jgi:surface protein
MYNRCSSLESIDLSSFNTNNVINMNDMFKGCSSLKSLDLSSFNTNNVTIFVRYLSWQTVDSSPSSFETLSDKPLIITYSK